MLMTRDSLMVDQDSPAKTQSCSIEDIFASNRALVVMIVLALAISSNFQNILSAAPVVQGVVPPPGHDIHEIIEGVTTDLFDVAQGTVVTSSSALFPTFDARSALGYFNPTGIELTRTIFNDSTATTTDFIEFQTSLPIDLGYYRLFLGQDSDGTGPRAATASRLYASSNSADVLSHLVSSASFSPPYAVNYGSGALSISETLNLVHCHA